MSGEECVVVGLLFRKMELQPGILKEICDEENVVPLPVSEKYAADDDQVLLVFIYTEDVSVTLGRMHLICVKL